MIDWRKKKRRLVKKESKGKGTRGQKKKKIGFFYFLLYLRTRSSDFMVGHEVGKNKYCIFLHQIQLC